MSQNQIRNGENCHHCAYNEVCLKQDAMLDAMHQLGEKEMREFLESHPDASKLRRLIFMLFAV